MDYVIAGVAAVGLFIYLSHALLGNGAVLI
jgi:hypothetical protein